MTECRVLYAANGAELEKRIANIVSNFKAAGYKDAWLLDCFNLEYADITQR